MDEYAKSVYAARVRKWLAWFGVAYHVIVGVPSAPVFAYLQFMGGFQMVVKFKWVDAAHYVMIAWMGLNPQTSVVHTFAISMMILASAICDNESITQMMQGAFISSQLPCMLQRPIEYAIEVAVRTCVLWLMYMGIFIV